VLVIYTNMNIGQNPAAAIGGSDGAEILAAMQTPELTQIEQDMGPRGDRIINDAWNVTHTVGVVGNNLPQSYVVKQGREVPSAVTFGDKTGWGLAKKGVDEYNAVDNWSYSPIGTYTINVGNKFTVNAAGGGILLASKSRAKIHANQIIIGADTQTLITGADVVINGPENVTIQSNNLNLQSDNQIVMNGNVGMNNNLLLKGGAYLNGEVFINHITAPLEIQQTIPGFTKEGAFGFLRNGSYITTEINDIIPSFLWLVIPGLNDDEPIPCLIPYVPGQPSYLIQKVQSSSSGCVELAPHAHEFPNLPLTLVQ